jgi:hypothetical protein
LFPVGDESVIAHFPARASDKLEQEVTCQMNHAPIGPVMSFTATAPWHPRP